MAAIYDYKTGKGESDMTHDITIRTVTDPDVLTCGLREEYDACQRDGVETEIALIGTERGVDDIVALWLPNDGRAGLSSNHGTGNDQWTDARDINDAVRRYEYDDMNP
jgi:hypothetical protein